LIDAYDVLASDSMNEFDRFAWAYLLLVGFQLKEKDLKEIKRKRVFEKLPDKSAVDFLTKDIPTEFIQFMANWIKQEIHKQSFIPDIDELKFSGAVSGVAIDKFIYLMEYVAVDKESFYHLGLKKRLKMINRITPFKDLNKIEIQFTRNLPNNEVEKVDNYVKLDGRGISRETLIKHYLTWVKDPQAELEKAIEEQDLFSPFNIEENMNAGQEPDSQQQYTK
jgi:SPP1 family phage portal protein